MIDRTKIHFINTEMGISNKAFYILKETRGTGTGQDMKWFCIGHS